MEPVSGNNLFELIPQRPPMVMIGSLMDCDGPSAKSSTVIEKGQLFTDDTGMTAPGMMEAMAQTAAARTGWLLKKQPGDRNKMPPVGVIGSIKNFRLHFRPPFGSTMVTTIVVEHEVLMASVISGKVEVEGKLAAEAQLQIFLNENQD